MNGPQKYFRKLYIDEQSQSPQENSQTGGFLKRRWMYLYTFLDK